MRRWRLLALSVMMFASFSTYSVRASHVPYLEEWGIYELDLSSGQVKIIYSWFERIETLRVDEAGERFAFTVRMGGDEYEKQEICVLGVDGGGFSRLTDNTQWDLYPAWSPDGSEIAYLSWRNETLDIWVMNSDGGGQRLLYDSGYHDADIHWIGNTVAFTRNSQIWVMNSDGSDARRLTDPPRAGEWGDAVLPFGDYDPRISPDGSRVVYERMVDDSSPHGNYDLITVNMDGTGETRLTDNGWTQGLASWSGDGERLVYLVSAVGSEGRYDIYIIYKDGTDMKDLTSTLFPPGFLAHSPVFSADDASIYFIGQWWDWKMLDTALTIDVSADQVSSGETVMVTGELKLGVHEAEIRLTYTRPDGTEYTRDIFTEEGMYRDSIQPEYHGDWTVKASWMGDPGHHGSSSETRSFTVAEQPQGEGRGIPGFPAAAVIAGVALYLPQRDFFVPCNTEIEFLPTTRYCSQIIR